MSRVPFNYYTSHERLTLFFFTPKDNFLIGELFHACSVTELGTRALEKCPCQETCPALTSDPTVQAVADTNLLTYFAPASDAVVVIDKSIDVSLHRGAFFSTGIQNNQLPTGSLLVQIEDVSSVHYGGVQWHETYAGLMSWYHGADTTGAGVSQIPLSQSGHAANAGDLFLQTREGQGYVALDFKSNEVAPRAMPIKFKFRQVIPGDDTPLPLQNISPENTVDHTSFFPIDLKLSPSAENGGWTDTGIERDDLFTGTYFVQVRSVSTIGNVEGGTAGSAAGLEKETFTGLLSWYDATTNHVDSDEILLQSAGLNSNGCTVRLRTTRRLHTEGRGGLALQMATSCGSVGSGTTDAQRFNFVFKLAVPGPLPANAPLGNGVDQFKVIKRNLRLGNVWQSVGIAGNDLVRGTYLVQIASASNYQTGGGLFFETVSAILQWYPDTTNGLDGGEVVNAHMAGHARGGNSLKLRFKEVHPVGPGELQIWFGGATNAATEYTFVFRLMIA